MKTWNIKYKGHEITVQNGWFSGERLIVDGQTQDRQKGFGCRSRLWGKIKDGDAAGKPIKVTLGGWFIIGCCVFVDDELIHSGN